MGSLSKRLKALRKENRISQKKLAVVLNVSPATISRYEQETISPTEENIVKVAIYFNVSADYLLGLSANPKVHSDVLKDYEKIREKAEKFDQVLRVASKYIRKN